MKLTLAAASAILAFASAAPTNPNIFPDKLSRYEVWSGKVTYDVPTGQIFKDGKTTDITTLLTFTFPDATAGKTCEFDFALNNCLHCNPSPPTGTLQFDAYTAIKPADRSTNDWPSGNLRDQYIGRLKAVKPGIATPVEGFPHVGPFPCPAGKTLGGELVGAGDQVNIQWDGKGEGPYFRVY
jgi:hypothetical protein